MNGQKDMYWVAPLTSRIAKFDEIVAKKQVQGKSTDIFFKTQVRDKDTYILFADMFKEARKVVTLLEKGVKFARTSPDVKRITKVQIERENDVMKKLQDFVEKYNIKMPDNEQQERKR